MNITILDHPIFYIIYISQVLSMSPIVDKLPMDARRNIFVVTIDN